MIRIFTASISAKGLAGAMFWSLDLDDFKGNQCGEGKYPLMKAVANALGGYTPGPEPTQGPRPKTTKASPKTEKPGGGKCRATGAFTGNTRMNEWCAKNCARGNCPSRYCKC